MLRLILLILMLQSGVAMYTLGTIDVPGNGTLFLAKFCFTFDPDDKAPDPHLDPHRPSPGILEVKTELLSNHQGEAHILLFDDEAESYPSPTGWNAMTCEERLRHAKNKYPLRNPYTSLRISIREKLRPRYWYVALADCSGSGVKVNYEIRARNPPYGWLAHFPSDKRLAPPIFLVMMLVFACLACLQMRSNHVLAQLRVDDSTMGKAAHPFARLLALGITLQFSSCVCALIHNWAYSADGEGIFIVYVLSLVLERCSSFVLISMLLLVAQGKCVSYVMVRADVRRMFWFLGPFLLSTVCLEIWGDYATSRRYTTDYIYTTPFGWAIIAVKLVLLGVYSKDLQKTLLQEGDRADGQFYRTWGLAYASWFVALPMVAFLAQVVLAPYVSYTVSLVVTQSYAAIVYGALVFSLWPENTKTHFKYIKARPEDYIEDCMTPPHRRELARSHQSDYFKGAREEDQQSGLPNLLASIRSMSVKETCTKLLP
eukprot:TRINITY_DN97919_c0_g1_i1.p1 TRINITY_DN97919_c0_g1~~TRINITY_DN97919_c0_g1_i1.p1  ORF type:complete len:485 (-),score=28.07 TRINITY_DN97919_c0_g1_i1:364-1818(-)